MRGRLWLYIKKGLKIAVWITAILLLLFFILVYLIRIPAIQSAVVHRISDAVSDKTHTTVEVESVRISFPKSVVIKGVFLDDLKGDTLLAAGNIRINVVLRDLLLHRISVNRIALSNLSANIHRSQPDSLFNFSFLITAFASEDHAPEADTSTSQPWRFRVDRVNLTNIQVGFADEISGIDAGLTLQKLRLKMDEFDPVNAVYSLNSLLIDGLQAAVIAEKEIISSNDMGGGVLPDISARRIVISNTGLKYNDRFSGITTSAALTRLELDDGSVGTAVAPSSAAGSEEGELQILAGRLELTKGSLSYLDEVYRDTVNPNLQNTKTGADEVNPDAHNTNTGADTVISNGQNLNTGADTVINNMQDQPVGAYSVDQVVSQSAQFDSHDFSFNIEKLSASDLHYSEKMSSGNISSLIAVDQNGFAVNHFQTEFTMDGNSAMTKNLRLKTGYSSLAADLKIQFHSLQRLSESIESLTLDLDLQKLEFRNSDILYFVPQLSNAPFFNSPKAFTSVSGSAEGRIDSLVVTSLLIETGARTQLTAGFTITGLPSVDSLYVSLPEMLLASGRNDIELVAGSYIPDNISLPEQFNLQLTFTGSLNAFDAKATVESSFGDIQLSALLNENEAFWATVNSSEFNPGLIINDTTLFGPVSLSAEVQGKGLKKSTLTAKVDADVPMLTLKGYTYRGLRLDGVFSNQIFEGRVVLKDENLDFDFEGVVNLRPGEEQYRFRLELNGAGLQQLNFAEDDIRIALVAEADLNGAADMLNGTVEVSDIMAVRGAKLYELDSLTSDFSNIPGNSEWNINSDFFTLNYVGTMSPVALPEVLKPFLNRYFPLPEDEQLAYDLQEEDSDNHRRSIQQENNSFNFEIELRDHPIVKDLLLPDLTVFEPGIIRGSFDSRTGDLLIDAGMQRLVYGAVEISDLNINLKSDSAQLNYSVKAGSLGAEFAGLQNLLLVGKMAENRLTADLSSADTTGMKFAVSSVITKENANYKLVIEPDNLYLMYNPWEIDSGNQILFGPQGVNIQRFNIKYGLREVRIASLNQEFSEDISIDIRNFELEDLSRIVEKNPGLLKGTVDGTVLLSSSDVYSIIADATVNNLILRNVPVGNLSFSTTNPSVDRYDLRLGLSGAGNEITAGGFLTTGESGGSINLKVDVASFSMKTLEAFVPGQITETDGTLSGNAIIRGSPDAPEVTGELRFNEVFVRPAVLNNRLGIANETIQLKSDGLYFDTFTITDPNQQSAILNGSVKMETFRDFTFALQLKADEFLLMNTTVKENETLFGRMVIDSDIEIGGPLDLPVVSGRLKLKRGSHVTFVVPESRLTTDRGEDVVIFDNPVELHPILNIGVNPVASSQAITGVDLSTILEIDRNASLRLLMDPTSTDSLVVRGDAALSLIMDKSGKISLTGVYSIEEGSYLVSLESVIKRRFDIVKGSSITWNGDPMDAILSLDALYAVRASPYDLVASQVAGLSDADKAMYRQQVPINVLLKLRGDMLKPEISFGIELPPEEKGALGGVLNQKLVLLNQDASALNKQVFALLILGRFVQENPLVTETGGTAAIVRSTVGNFLSSQLNRLGAGVLPGTELSVDIQSYEEFQAETPQGRTEVEVGIRQQLFNERLSVQVGGTVDVEGERAHQNRASDITGDVTVEYKLTEDGRLRLKGFRHNQYEGTLEGEVIETGAGVSFTRDFNKWKELFKSPESKETSGNKEEEELKRDSTEAGKDKTNENNLW